MKFVLTTRAEADLANQFDYGVRKFGRATSEQTLERVYDYLNQTLLRYPRTSNYHHEIEAFETWIPKTPFVIFYRIDEVEDRLIVLALYHHAQDRSDFTPD